MKSFKKHTNDRSVPKGFYRNKDGSVSIDHDTSNDRSGTKRPAPIKKKSINELFGLGKKDKRADHEKSLADHAAEHNKEDHTEHLKKHSADIHKHSHDAGSVKHFKSYSGGVNSKLIEGHKKGLKHHEVHSINQHDTHHKHGQAHEEGFESHAHVHHTIMKHAKPLGKKMTLYHGSTHDFGAAAKKNKGILHSPAHLSTSHDHKVASEFAGQSGGRHIVAIHAKKKDKAVYLDGKTKNKGENETVVPAGTKLKHIKSHKTSDGHTVHHFEVHDQSDTHQAGSGHGTYKDHAKANS